MPLGDHASNVAEQGGGRHDGHSVPRSVKDDKDGQHDLRRACANYDAEDAGASASKKISDGEVTGGEVSRGRRLRPLGAVPRCR